MANESCFAKKGLWQGVVVVCSLAVSSCFLVHALRCARHGAFTFTRVVFDYERWEFHANECPLSLEGNRPMWWEPLHAIPPETGAVPFLIAGCLMMFMAVPSNLASSTPRAPILYRLLAIKSWGRRVTFRSFSSFFFFLAGLCCTIAGGSFGRLYGLVAGDEAQELENSDDPYYERAKRFEATMGTIGGGLISSGAFTLFSLVCLLGTFLTDRKWPFICNGCCLAVLLATAGLLVASVGFIMVGQFWTKMANAANCLGKRECWNCDVCEEYNDFITEDQSRMQNYMLAAAFLVYGISWLFPANATPHPDEPEGEKPGVELETAKDPAGGGGEEGVNTEGEGGETVPPPGPKTDPTPKNDEIGSLRNEKAALEAQLEVANARLADAEAKAKLARFAEAEARSDVEVQL